MRTNKSLLSPSHHPSSSSAACKSSWCSSLKPLLKELPWEPDRASRSKVSCFWFLFLLSRSNSFAPPFCPAYIGHTYTRSDGLSGVILTDPEYPTRVVFTLLQKILDDFSEKYPKAVWSTPSQTPFPPLADYLAKYQDPKQADPIMKVQKDLDETKIILVCLHFIRKKIILSSSFSFLFSLSILLSV